MSEPRHAHWAVDSLWQQLAPLLPGLSVEVLASCDSTNTRLLERARLAAGDLSAAARPDVSPGQRGRRSGDAEPLLLVAEHQAEGRGRLGRNWHATPGASLTFSLALPLAPHSWQGLSLAVGLALAEALEPLSDDGVPRVLLKWPNDLWLRDAPGPGRKLGGVLIETVGMNTGASTQRMTVVGVGLNVLPQVLDGLSSGYACTQELLPGITAPALLHRVAPALVRGLLDFQSHGFAALTHAYARRDLLRGQAVSTTLAELPQGVAEGVADDGALQVRAGGRLHPVSSGEVSIRLQPATTHHGERPC
jgi:BirA family transcriptional regulator, biotin operon repressor / biotin---[acetyl-CoA-carboxylase] ligase